MQSSRESKRPDLESPVGVGTTHHQTIKVVLLANWMASFVPQPLKLLLDLPSTGCD
jgi:hypothetical protein